MGAVIDRPAPRNNVTARGDKETGAGRSNHQVRPYNGGLKMRKSLLAAIGVLALGTVPWQESAGQDKFATTLAQDRKKLAEGLWRTDDWRKEGATGWQCHAGISLQALDSPRLSLTINFERG